MESVANETFMAEGDCMLCGSPAGKYMVAIGREIVGRLCSIHGAKRERDIYERWKAMGCVTVEGKSIDEILAGLGG